MKNYNLEKIKVENTNAIKFLLNYLKSRKFKLAGIILIIILAATTQNFIPFLIRKIIDTHISENDLKGLIRTTNIASLLLIIGFILQILQTKFIGQLGQSILFDIRQDLIKKIENLPLRFFTQNNSGDIITRITNDVDSINKMFSQGILRAINIIFKLLLTGIMMFILNRTLTITLLLPLSIILIFLSIQGSKLQELLKESLNLNAKVSNQIQDILHGFPVIKAATKENYFIKKFNKINEKYFKATIRSSLINSIATPTANLLTKLGLGLVFMIAFQMIKNEELTIGILLSFFTYAIQLTGPISKISQLSNVMRNGLASTARIAGIIKLQSDIVTPQNPYKPKQMQGKIQFKDVNFYYNEREKILHDINFTIQPQEKIAIVGQTGSGKTTFVNLIARLYDVDTGAVLIDGVNVKKWDKDFLRKKIGYLLQDTFLFQDTIFNNLKYCDPNLTREKANKILNDLHFHNLFKNKTIDLDTKVNDNFSVGQKQIIAIARILIQKPKILILDEATASIDTRSEQIVQEAIDYATQKSTSIIIAHRLNTISNVDKTIVIKNGRIAEYGSKDELLEKKGDFYKLWKRFHSI